MRLTQPQQQVLLALSNGSTLKSQRYLDGAKVFQLHPLHGPAEPVKRATVQALVERGLIDSNQKFPAATYRLTEQGRQAVKEMCLTRQ
jgi:hypothetical protein